MGRLITFAMSIVLLASCSSGNHVGGRSSLSKDVQHSAAAPRNPNNTLTGFGATVPNWNARHQADPDPALATGCCYLPKVQSNVGNRPQDTWFAVLTDDVVYLYQRAFPSGTNEDEATAALQADDLPPDAKLVKSKVGAGCKLFLYRSLTLSKVAPDVGAFISVYFESYPQPNSYDASNVSDAGLAGSGPSIGRC